MDGLCNEKLGSKSYYNSSDKSCYCYDGYAIKDNTCQILPTPVPPATISPTAGIPLVPPTPIVIPTLAAIVVPKHATITSTKAPVKKSVVQFDPDKKVPGLHSFVAVKKKQGGFFERVLTAIYDAIKFAFNL